MSNTENGSETLPFGDVFSGSNDTVAEDVQEDQETVDAEEGDAEEQEAATQEVEAAQESTEDEQEPEDSEEGESEEDDQEDVPEWKSEMDKLEKRLADTQKWGNEQSQKAAEQTRVLEKLLEEGTISQEQFDELKIAEPQADDPFQVVRERVATDYPALKSYMEAQGENPELYAEAFERMVAIDPAIQQQLLQTKPEAQVSFMLTKGKEMAEDYTILKEAGSLPKAFDAVREKAVEEYKASLKAESKPQTTSPKGRPKMRGGAQPTGGENKVMSFNDVFSL